MPRKRKVPTSVSYLVPEDAKVNIDLFIESSDKFRNKPVWKQKFYHLFHYIVEQMINNDDPDKFVNVNCATMAKVLSVNNQEMAGILRDCIQSGILKCDKIAEQAAYATQGKKRVIVKEGKSYGYLFKKDSDLIEITIEDNRRCHEKALNWRRRRNYHTCPDLKLYDEVLKSMTIDETGLDETFQKILVAKRLEINNDKEYKEYIENIEQRYYYSNNNNITNYIAFNGAFVPDMEAKIAANSKLKRNKEKIIKRMFDSELSLFNQYKSSIRRINSGSMIADRPSRLRVYTEITRLKRELRKHLRLDGKPLIGIDIRNSQPLIACIVINEYWKANGGIPSDVRAYQAACEEGRFYDDVITILGIKKELRPQFKKDFFHRVYFSMVLKQRNMLVDLFEQKYPNVWMAICNIKGGELSRDYKLFSRHLQKEETELIFSNVNIKLIKQGIKCVNVFDCLYVTSENDYKIAEIELKRAFHKKGINPTFNIDHL